jgi:hypothetical protein
LKPERWGSPLVQEEKYQEKSVIREGIIIIMRIISQWSRILLDELMQSVSWLRHSSLVMEP